MTDLLTTKDMLLCQVDIRLRRRYVESWDTYTRLVRTNESVEARGKAYKAASLLGLELDRAVRALEVEQDRIRGRKKMKATR